MKNERILSQIYNLIKEYYGDCLTVTINVNCEGIDVVTNEKPFTIGYTMKTINGKQLKKKESYELGLYDQ